MKKRPTYELIKENPLFSTFSNEEIDEMLNNLNYNLRTYQKEEYLFIQGDECKTIFLLLKGTIEVQKIDPSGKMLLLMDVDKDEVIGAGVVFSGHDRHQMSAFAKSDIAVLEMDKSSILKLCRSNENFLELFLKSLSGRTYMLTQRIREVTLKTLREKICEYLYSIHSDKGSLDVRIPFTKKYWAETLGVQRPSLSRELANLSREGLINMKGDLIRIIDLAEVRKIALKS
jgi:CRP-like cAMP-binding protein